MQSVVFAWLFLTLLTAMWHLMATAPRTIKCIHCENKRWVRWAFIGIVGLQLAYHATNGNVHFPDFGFFALVVVSEWT